MTDYPGSLDIMTDTIRLEEGDTAPAFTLTDDTGSDVSLSDYAGRKVLVYFYPQAATPGCTTEACDFRDNLGELNDLGIEVVGVSPDPVDKLAQFKTDEGLNFPLLSDPDKKVMTEWGAFGKKNSYGRIVESVIRSTLLVDEEGKIALAKYNVKATGHVARILRDIAA